MFEAPPRSDSERRCVDPADRAHVSKRYIERPRSLIERHPGRALLTRDRRDDVAVKIQDNDRRGGRASGHEDMLVRRVDEDFAKRGKGKLSRARQRRTRRGPRNEGQGGRDYGEKPTYHFSNSLA